MELGPGLWFTLGVGTLGLETLGLEKLGRDTLGLPTPWELKLAGLPAQGVVRVESAGRGLIAPELAGGMVVDWEEGCLENCSVK